MKTQFQKRAESFAWRAGMMILAVAVDYAISNIGAFKIPAEFTVVAGLLLGEASKAIKTEIDFRNEIKGL